MIPNIAQIELEAMLAEAALLSHGVEEKKIGIPTFGNPPSVRSYKARSNRFLGEMLSLPQMQAPAVESDIRLRIALHLAPPTAIAYDPKRLESRKELVFNYLKSHFAFSEETALRLSRYVAVVLDSWDAQRVRGLASRKAQLLPRQSYRCNCCAVALENQSRILQEETNALKGIDDPYKPYFDGNGVVDSIAPVVDHILVVSREGTNASDNLQVLCNLCNSGKGDNSGMKASKELLHCHQPISQIPRGHRIRMLYYRLQMDGFTCTHCAKRENEMTIRKIRSEGAYVLTNLRTLCYSCIQSSA